MLIIDPKMDLKKFSRFICCSTSLTRHIVAFLQRIISFTNAWRQNIVAFLQRIISFTNTWRQNMDKEQNSKRFYFQMKTLLYSEEDADISSSENEEVLNVGANLPIVDEPIVNLPTPIAAEVIEEVIEIESSDSEISIMPQHTSSSDVMVSSDLVITSNNTSSAASNKTSTSKNPSSSSTGQQRPSTSKFQTKAESKKEKKKNKKKKKSHSRHPPPEMHAVAESSQNIQTLKRLNCASIALKHLIKKTRGQKAVSLTNSSSENEKINKKGKSAQCKSSKKNEKKSSSSSSSEGINFELQHAVQIASSSSSSEAQTKNHPPIPSEQYAKEAQVTESASDSENDVQIVGSVCDSGHESIIYAPIEMETSSESEDEKKDPSYDPKNK